MSFPHHQRVTPVAKHISELTTPTPGVRTATLPAPDDVPDSGAAPVRIEVRLRVKPNTASRGHVDGAWWPRSRRPAAEFPGLILAMSSWVGPVRRVAYRLDDWNPTASELTVEGWPVTLAGLSTLQENTVVVAGTDQRRMALLVVPPHTPGDIARAVLRSMTGPDATGTVEEILARHGVAPTGRHPRVAAGIDQ